MSQRPTMLSSSPALVLLVSGLLVACGALPPGEPSPGARAGAGGEDAGSSPGPGSASSDASTSEGLVDGGASASGGDLATGASTIPGPAYRTAQGKLFDPCGVEVVLRGVNKMAVYADRAGDSFPEIAKTGANTVRFMWLSEVAGAEAVQTLQRAVDSHLIPIWELHDATGDFSKMPQVKAFWTAAATITVLKQFEAHLIVNLANEAGQAVSNSTMISTYVDIISALRGAGLRMPFMIDAAGYGRNVEQLLAVAPALLSADPLHNLMFSWHVYDPGADQVARIDGAIASAQAQMIPFLVGEFGNVSPGACGNAVPYQHLIAQAQAKGIGYLPWSWDNFNGDCDSGSGSPFNLVGDGIHLSTLLPGWATEVLISDAASIEKTAKRSFWQLNPDAGRCGP